MSIRRYCMLVAVLAGTQSFVMAQDSSTQNPPATNPSTQSGAEQRQTPPTALSGIMGIDTQIEQEDTSANLPRIPAILGGTAPSLEFRAEQERSNYLRGGINVGGTYDDNVSLLSHGAVSDTTYSVFPNIAIEQTFSRVRWNLGYAAGLTVNQRLSNRNQGSHALNFDSQFRLSPHVTLRVQEGFSVMTGFFDSGTGLVAGGGGPNANLIAPLSKQRLNSTVGEADYHFALNDVMGVSGSFNDLHFSDQGTAQLADNRTVSGSGFWLHGFGRNWLGASYQFQHLTFDPASGSMAITSGATDVHSFFAVDTITLPSRFTLAAFVGPEYSDNRGLVSGTDASSHFTDWSMAGGVEVGWQREHTGLAAGFSRRLSSGGGISGVVRLQDVHGSFRQELSPGWALGLSASYGNNKALTLPVAAAATLIDTASTGISLERNLGRNIALRLGYMHDFQDQAGTADSDFLGAAHRNRFIATIGYQWARPLGR
jgi:hypothetical protein